MHAFTVAISLATVLIGLSSSQSFAQAAPAAPAGTGGAAATAATGSPNGGSSRDLYQRYDPMTIPSGALSSPVQNPIYGGTIYNYSPPTNPIGAYLASCMQGAGALMGSLGASMQMRAQMDRINDEAGFKPYEGISRSVSRRNAGSILSSFTPEAGCQKFINKQGDIGPWGRTMLGELEKYKDVYEEHTPADASKYCPSFPSMDAERRKMFWLWFFASVSQPESSCRSNATAAGPNGTAIGLFQLDAPACKRAGVYVSSSELMEPANNIRCAVAVFANEMRNRGTIMVGTSRGSRGTYWGTLRNDDSNGARGGDVRAARGTRALISQYPDCKG